MNQSQSCNHSDEIAFEDPHCDRTSKTGQDLWQEWSVFIFSKTKNMSHFSFFLTVICVFLFYTCCCICQLHVLDFWYIDIFSMLCFGFFIFQLFEITFRLRPVVVYDSKQGIGIFYFNYNKKNESFEFFLLLGCQFTFTNFFWIYLE